MVKKFYVKNIDCANCAAKAERAVAKVKGVNYASLNFLTETLIMDVEDLRAEEIIESALNALRKKEPEAEIIAR